MGVALFGEKPQDENLGYQTILHTDLQCSRVQSTKLLGNGLWKDDNSAKMMERSGL